MVQIALILIFFFFFQVPSMDYPTIAKSAFQEGPEWLRKYSTFVV